LICAFDPERSHNSVKRREMYGGKEPLKGRYVRYSKFPYLNGFWSILRPNRRWNRWAVGNPKGGCVCHLDTHIQSILLVIGSDRSNRRLKVRWARKRKPERGYTLCLDSHISVSPCDEFFQSAPPKWEEKKRDVSWKNAIGGLYATQISISFNSCDY